MVNIERELIKYHNRVFFTEYFKTRFPVTVDVL